MTIKPFAIQGADLTLGGVNLQAGATAVVIPGVTQAANYRVDEVEDNDDVDQTYNTYTEITVIDAALYYAIVNDLNTSHFADYVTELDDDGYIDEIEVGGSGTYTVAEAERASSNDMYAYIGTGQGSDRPLIPEDWIQIPFRPKMRAGEVENIGGGSGSLGAFNADGTELYVDNGETITINTFDENGDQRSQLFLDADNGRATLSATSGWDQGTWVSESWASAEFQPREGTSGGQIVITNSPALTQAFADFSNLGAENYQFQCTGSGEGYRPGDGYSQNGNDFVFYVGGETPEEITTVTEFSLRYQVRAQVNMDQDDGSFDVAGRNLSVTLSSNNSVSIEAGSDVNINAGDDIRITATDVFSLRNTSTTDPISIVTDYTNNEHTWSFDEDGILHLPVGGDIVDSNGVSVLGGAVQPGPLYIMANTDGNISTSVDGDTWSNAVDMGINIGTVAIGPDKIVYTRADHNGDAGGLGGGGIGLYSTNSPLVPPTLIAGTEGNPGGDMTWLQVQYFDGTAYPWVAVGYQSQTYQVPVIAYSTNGAIWEITYYTDDGTYATQNLEFTDIAYSDGLYLISARAGTDPGGLWYTTDLTTDITIANHVALPANFATVEYWDLGGESGFYGRWHAMTDDDDWWNGVIDPTDQNNWSDQDMGPAIANAILDSTGISGQTMEESASGEVTGGPWMWLTSSSNGHIVHQSNGPVGYKVSIPSPYTSVINDIVRNESNEGAISQFTHVPTNTTQNTNWTPTNTITPTVTTTNGTVTFEIIVDGDSVLTSINATAQTGYVTVDETITVLGSLLGGTDSVDDIVITVVEVTPNRPTTITFTAGGEEGFIIDGEKITLAGVTSVDASEPGTSEQSYNGTYYIKRIGSDPTYTYELYTDQALTDPWNTSSYWPVNQDTGTITWSHGMYLDSLGFANGHFYVGNDTEEIFKSTWNPEGDTLSWTKVDDKNNSLQYWNDFAYYGAFGAGTNTGSITFDGVDIQGDGNLDMPGSINLVPNQTLKSAGQYVRIYPTNQFDYPHVHIDAGTDGELYIGDDEQYIKTGVDGNIGIRSYNSGTAAGHVWNFGIDGALTFPTLTVPISDNANPTGTGQTLKFSEPNLQAIIFGPAATADYTSAERIIIQGAPGYAGTSGEGGDVYLWAGPGGDVDGGGGDIKVRAGQGNGSGYGGYLNFQAGDSSTGYGGYVNIESGSGALGGGRIEMYARTGGDIDIRVVDTGTVQIHTEGNSWTFAADGALTLPGAVVNSTVSKTGVDLTSNNVKFEVTQVDGLTGAVTELIVTNSPNSAWVAGTGGLALGDVDFSISFDGSGNASVVINSGGVSHTVGQTFELNPDAVGATVPTPTAIDLTKTVNKLTDGIYSLADGVEGQIMYLVRQTGSNAANIGIEVANARVDGSLYSTRSHYPFSGGGDSLTTMIFTAGAWQSTNGGWSIVG